MDVGVVMAKKRTKKPARAPEPKREVTTVSVHFKIDSVAGAVNHLAVVTHLVRMVRAGKFRTMIDPCRLLWSVLGTSATLDHGDRVTEIHEDIHDPQWEG